MANEHHDLGLRLRAARLNAVDPATGRHWSQDEVANQLHVGRTTVVGWEAGRHHPRGHLWQLAALYGVTTGALLGDEEAARAVDPSQVVDPNEAAGRRLTDLIPVKAVPVLRAAPQGPLWLRSGLAGSAWEPLDSPADYALAVDESMAAVGTAPGERVYCRRLKDGEEPEVGALAVVVTPERTLLRYVAPRGRVTKGPGQQSEALAAGARIDAVAVKVERPAPALPD